jgi:hypothetical protein
MNKPTLLQPMAMDLYDTVEIEPGSPPGNVDFFPSGGKDRLKTNVETNGMLFYPKEFYIDSIKVQFESRPESHFLLGAVIRLMVAESCWFCAPLLTMDRIAAPPGPVMPFDLGWVKRLDPAVHIASQQSFVVSIDNNHPLDTSLVVARVSLCGRLMREVQ